MRASLFGGDPEPPDWGNAGIQGLVTRRTRHRLREKNGKRYTSGLWICRSHDICRGLVLGSKAPSQEGGEAMPLTRGFRETVQARARRDRKFREAS